MNLASKLSARWARIYGQPVDKLACIQADLVNMAYAINPVTAAIEIKLGNNKIEEAKETLLTFKNNMIKKPKFMCIITANQTFVAKDKETGIYILPITALKP